MDGQIRFVPFVKVDAARKWVYGRATDETVDVEGEVVDYEATRRAVEEWGKWRNVREMHGPNAVGVAEQVVLNDAQRALEVGVKIVDDLAWEKVRLGVYKGFSIGGRRLAAKVEKTAGGEVKRITDYLMTEISLVDRPANPNAVFSLVKREGGDMSVSSGQESVGSKQGTLGVEEVKALVIQILKELGLLSQEFIASAARVDDLRKVDSLAKRVGKVEGQWSQSDATLQKAMGDLVKVVAAIGALEERLDIVHKMAAGQGPVLREIGFWGPGGIEDRQQLDALKELSESASDPHLRQAIMSKIAELQIRAVHGQEHRIEVNRW
jgi:hypothetical protein